MPYCPPEKVEIPNHVLEFAKDFSRYKTPARRTRGAPEPAGQRRGEGDWIDTVATLMLWQELVRADIPATFHMTANTGDETDLRVQRKGSSNFLDINVKATKTPVPNHQTAAQYGNLPLKHEELGIDPTQWHDENGNKLEPNPVELNFQSDRPYATADRSVQLADIYIKVFVHTNETSPIESDHVHLTNWLSVIDKEFKEEVEEFNTSIKNGTPKSIPGIGHFGIWAPSSRCHRYSELFAHLKNFLMKEDPNFLLRWERLDAETSQKRIRGELKIYLDKHWIHFDAGKDTVTVAIPNERRLFRQFKQCEANLNQVASILREGFDSRVVKITIGRRLLISRS